MTKDKINFSKYGMHHRDTEDTEDNETEKISETLCALCDSVVNKFYYESSEV
jgi:hypothetical protein